MYLSFKPAVIVSPQVADTALLSALEEAFDLRLRRHDEPKTAALQTLLTEVVPMEEIRRLGMEHLPYFLDCFAAWILLEYLHRNEKIQLGELNLQKMFDFEYLDTIVRRHEKAYVSLVNEVRQCGC